MLRSIHSNREIGFSSMQFGGRKGVTLPKIKILEDVNNANSKFSNTSAGIVFFAKAQGKQSSMHSYRPKSGPHTSSHSGKRGTTHHGGLICLQTDGNFANHTTEMTL